MVQSSVLQKTLLDELGLDNLPQEKKDELLIQMAEVVLKRIYLNTFDSLPDADREEFGKMLDEEAGPEKIEAFLREKFEDYDDFVKKIVEAFKEEMKETMADLEQTAKKAPVPPATPAKAS